MFDALSFLFLLTQAQYTEILNLLLQENDGWPACEDKDLCLYAMMEIFILIFLRAGLVF